MEEINVLVTGGAGFIGSHLIEHIIRTTKWNVVCVDKLSYLSKGWARLKDSGIYWHPRVKCITWDLEIPFSDGIITEIGDINIIIHMAAETHVDKSITDPIGCIRNNVMSTLYLLEYARTLEHLKMFQYFSTDEIYGSASEGISYKEWDPHRPGNPYSASKAASEDICLSYQNTYKLPILITNLMNVYGERQYIEKFIPKIIRKLLNDEVIDIHTDSNGKLGSRFYIHARNASDAVLFILENGISGEKYNIRGEKELSNLEIAQHIATIMGKELKYRLINPEDSRPGNDHRYCLDGSKLYNMGWKIPLDFEHSLEKMVKWTLKHKEWLQE